MTRIKQVNVSFEAVKLHQASHEIISFYAIAYRSITFNAKKRQPTKVQQSSM